MTISLNGSDLTVTQVMAVERHGEPVALALEAVGACAGPGPSSRASWLVVSWFTD